jgi:hypothetical protein
MSEKVKNYIDKNLKQKVIIDESEEELAILTLRVDEYFRDRAKKKIPFTWVKRIEQAKVAKQHGLIEL